MKSRAKYLEVALIAAGMLTAAEAGAQYDGSRWSRTTVSRTAIATPAPQPRAYVQRPYYYQPYYYQQQPYYYYPGYSPRYREVDVVYSEVVSYNYVDTRNTNQVFNLPYPQYRNFVPQPVAYTVMPAQVLADGTVLADFGLGFEPVRRYCGDQFIVVSAPPATNVNPKTQPAPNQATQSMRNATADQFPARTSAAQGACFALDSQGRYFVIR